MTEHIINFAIGIEDDKIRETIVKNAEKQIINDIKKDILDEIFTTQYGYGKATNKWYDGSVHLSNSACLSDFAISIIKDVVTKNRDLIIEKAVEALTGNLMKTKAVKEKLSNLCEVTNREVKNG